MNSFPTRSRGCIHPSHLTPSTFFLLKNLSKIEEYLNLPLNIRCLDQSIDHQSCGYLWHHSHVSKFHLQTSWSFRALLMSVWGKQIGKCLLRFINLLAKAKLFDCDVCSLGGRLQSRGRSFRNSFPAASNNTKCVTYAENVSYCNSSVQATCCFVHLPLPGHCLVVTFFAVRLSIHWQHNFASSEPYWVLL